MTRDFSEGSRYKGTEVGGRDIAEKAVGAHRPHGGRENTSSEDRWPRLINTLHPPTTELSVGQKPAVDSAPTVSGRASTAMVTAAAAALVTRCRSRSVGSDWK